jgi:hypothetical protein
MAFRYSPKIVTDGLVLYLDAANTKSYVSGSTTWNDISRGGNNGTLTNGPTFSSLNGGSIIFDGIDDYISTTIPTVRRLTGTRSSIGIWFKVVNSTVRGAFIADWNSAGSLETCRFEITGYRMTSTKIGGTINSAGGEALPIQSTTSILNNTWYNAVLQYDGTNTTLYLNGNLESTLVTAERGSEPNSSNSVSISRGGAFNGVYLNGTIGQTSIYNRALTAQEVLQNYNATKTRFGL